MTNFSFYNKANDLLELLKDKNFDDKQLKKYSNKDLKLAIDVIKTAYPLYANADDKTIIDFMKDTFEIDITKKDLIEANKKEEDIYRPVNILEIKPGFTCRIESAYVNGKGEKFPYYYNHSFPTKKVDNKKYSEYFFDIWEKAKKGKATVKHSFKHRIGDKVKHNDNNSIGIIEDRRMTNNFINEYSIHWNKVWTSKVITTAGIKNKVIDIEYKPWYKEEELINQTLLEALPMKTINKTKWKKYIAVISYKLLKYKKDPNKKDNEPDKIYYYEEFEERIIIGKFCKNIQDYIEDKYKTINATSIKLIRLESYKTETQFPKKKKIATKKIRRRKSVVKIPNCHKKYGKRRSALNESSKLVCVKHVTTEVVSRIKKSEAELLVNRDDSNYTYCSKLEWRKYLNTVKENKEKLRSDLNKEGKLNRKLRRSDDKKFIRNSNLFESQKIPIKVKEQLTSIKSIQPTLINYDENGNKEQDKIHFESNVTIPAHIEYKTIYKRKLPKKIVKVTDEIVMQQNERSRKDKNVYLNKKGYKSLSELKELFAKEERRNDHYSDTEKWSKSFKILLLLATTGRLAYPEKKIDIQLKRNDIYKWAKIIITEDNNLKWDDQKIKDFIRYLRLTSHKVFEDNKKTKSKKSKQNKVFEPVKFITKIDHSKLNYNLPEENKPATFKIKGETPEPFEVRGHYKNNAIWLKDGVTKICTLKDVVSWRYNSKNEFEDILQDKGGGIKQIPIKFKWKPPESLVKFFTKRKEDKLPF